MPLTRPLFSIILEIDKSGGDTPWQTGTFTGQPFRFFCLVED